MSPKDEKETPNLERREARDRPRDDNRIEMDVLLNIEIRQLKLMREMKNLLQKIDNNTKK